MSALALALLAAGAVFLVLGLATLMLAPVLAARLAATASRPKLERRASGPDRMRNIIQAQRSERSKRSTLATTLTRTGTGLGVLAVLSAAAGVLAWLAGY